MISGIQQLKRTLAIYKTKSRRTYADQVALGTVWYNGKLTLSGTWKEGIHEYTNTILRCYSRAVLEIEKRSFSISGGWVQGERIVISLPCTSRLETFEDVIFEKRACAFKLLLTWKENISSYCQKFDVVDLHTGDAMILLATIENSVLRIEVELAGSSCGNAVLRLLANIQQFLDGTAKCEFVEEVMRSVLQDAK